MLSVAKDVVVAHAVIEQEVDVRLEATASIQLRTGEPLTVRFAYHITESSHEQELWRLSLTTKCRGAERTAYREHRDRLAIKDDLWDAVEQTFVFDEPGSTTVQFQAQAIMRRLAWVGVAEPSVVDRGVSGALQVLVLP